MRTTGSVSRDVLLVVIGVTVFQKYRGAAWAESEAVGRRSWAE